jgi:HSP20 family protein
MNIIQRYQPARTWVHEINRLIDRTLADSSSTSNPREFFHESDHAWILRLDLPGFGRSDIALTVTDRVLQLVAETKPDQAFGGKIERQWNLGDDIEATAISAKLENGVLELTLPKRPPVTPQPTSIEIH